MATSAALTAEEQAKGQAEQQALPASGAEPIVSLQRQQIAPGSIGELLRQGTRAVEITHDERIRLIWDACIGTDGQSRPFWENSLLEFARNHHKGSTNSGDMLRFLPGSFGHIARKMVVFPAGDGSGRMATIPAMYSDEHAPQAIDQAVLRHAWELTSEILAGVLPTGQTLENYGVTLQLLKYPDSRIDLERVFDLFADSSGGWMAFGQRLDAFRSEACDALDKRILRDLYAFGSLVPGLRTLLVGLNRRLKRHDRFEEPVDGFTIGQAACRWHAPVHLSSVAIATALPPRSTMAGAGTSSR